MNQDKLSQHDNYLEGFCRGCLIKYDNPADLLQYTEKNRRLFVYSTGLQVKRNDTFVFQLCKDCYVNMKVSCKFKKQCRTSDKRFKSYLRLKEINDVDLCTFLKNSDDDTLRFPLMSGSSTPANQRNKDDDNESTCTSIQNFMTDILQGTEMPDTEARIIKEVIEEEADVLEESLDSHWLQDDVSIDTDFRLDFSFSPFSTSRSVNNDHCYTPTKQLEPSQSINNNHAKKVLEQLPTFRENDSDKDISINGINEAFRDICGETGIDIETDYMQDNLIEECINVNDEIPMFDTDPNMPDLDVTENNIATLSEIDIAVKNINMNFEPGNNRKNFYVLNDMTAELPIQDKHNMYLDNVVADQEQITECSIDKKLKQALENNNEEIPLEDLLVSPATELPNSDVVIKVEDLSQAIEDTTPEINVSQVLTTTTPAYAGFSEGASATTPLINNILFGEKIQLDDSNSSHKVGQCIETFKDVNGYIDELEEFFKEGVKDFDRIDSKETEIMEVDADITETIKPEKETPFDISEYYDSEQGVCKVCNKKVASEKGIKLHISRIHKIKVPKKEFIDKDKICPVCGLVVKNRGNFTKHVRTHKEEHKCSFCTLNFTSEWKLRQHTRIHDTAKTVKEEENKKHMCSACGATFSLACNLAAHARRHAAPRARACARCAKRFHTNYELARHQRIHSGEKPYVCPVSGCGKSFTVKYGLVTHMRLHTDEKPFQCDHCSVKFCKKGSLIRHFTVSKACMTIRGVYTKIKRKKKYQCYFCNQKFVTEGRFIRHQERSGPCVRKKEEMGNISRSSIKVQMPFLYVDQTNTDVTSTFTLQVLNEQEIRNEK